MGDQFTILASDGLVLGEFSELDVIPGQEELGLSLEYTTNVVLRKTA